VGWADRTAASAGPAAHPGLTVGIRPSADRASPYRLGPRRGRPAGSPSPIPPDRMVYVDYPTQRRILKRSAHWYRKVISDNGL
jgi:hypothetical protein